MKKYSLLLIMAAFLVGCSDVATSEEIISSNPASIESSQISSTSEEEQISSDPIISSSDDTTTSMQVPVGVWTKTVTFLNGGFTNSSLEQPASQAQFVNWFNGDNEKILDSINYTGYAQMNYIGNEKDSWRFSTLILGSQNSEGKITFNFNIDVAYIKVIVQPYTKYIEYTDTYNVDTNAKFLIDNKEYDLSLKEGYKGETEKVTIEQDFAGGTKSFSIANKEAGQRVFVHSLEITHWG